MDYKLQIQFKPVKYTTIIPEKYNADADPVDVPSQSFFYQGKALGFMMN